METIRQWLSTVDLNRLLTIFNIQIAIGIFIFFILFRSLFTRVIFMVYYKLINKKKNHKESSMYKIFNGFFIILGLYIAVRILSKSAQVTYFANKAFEVILIYCVARGISSQLVEDSVLMKRLFKGQENAINKLICNLLKILLWVVFSFIIVNRLGFNLSGFGGLVTGLGIVSAVAALAAQDMVKSILSGLVILTDKPFAIGDWIEVGDFEGTVIDITFRSVRLKSYNNAIVTIPNSTITETYISNWNRLTSRRFDCTLGISLNTPTEKVRKVIKEIRTTLKNHKDVISDTVTVCLNDITTGSINIKIFLYMSETNYGLSLMVRQDIYCSLLYLMEKEDIELVSYPTQTVYLNGKDEENTEQ